jgi:hypothetical protein
MMERCRGGGARGHGRREGGGRFWGSARHQCAQRLGPKPPRQPRASRPSKRTRPRQPLLVRLPAHPPARLHADDRLGDGLRRLGPGGARKKAAAPAVAGRLDHRARHKLADDKVQGLEGERGGHGGQQGSGGWYARLPVKGVWEGLCRSLEPRQAAAGLWQASSVRSRLPGPPAPPPLTSAIVRFPPSVRAYLLLTASMPR